MKETEDRYTKDEVLSVTRTMWSLSLTCLGEKTRAECASS